MLMHVRVVAPTDVAHKVIEHVPDHACVAGVAIHRNVGVPGQPESDQIEFDVAREGLNDLLEHLEVTGAGERGSVTMFAPTGTPYSVAEELEKAAPGDPADAVIWESVLEEAEDGSVVTVSFLILLTLAVTLAALAVLTDSAVLVVGAMVVGPEFAAVASVCLGVVFARWHIAGRAGDPRLPDPTPPSTSRG